MSGFAFQHQPKADSKSQCWQTSLNYHVELQTQVYPDLFINNPNLETIIQQNINIFNPYLASKNLVYHSPNI